MSRLAIFRAICIAACLALASAYVTEAATGIRQLTNTNAANLRPALSPDGNRIAFQSNREGADGKFHVYLMDADGSNVTQLTSGDTDDRHPAWSPDGRYVAVDSGDDAKREIWTIEVSSKRKTQVTSLGAIASFPSWSPDGKRIAFYLYQAGSMDIWMASPDASAPARLTRGLASEANSQCTFACHSVAWSPDGNRLAVADGDGARVQILSATNGSVTQTVSPDGERSHFPAYLPDGRLVYVTEHITIDASWTDLWLVDPNAGGARTELASKVQAQGPFEFTSDAGGLLFSSPRTGNFEIYAVTLDAEGKAALATKPARLTPSETRQTAPGEGGFRLPTQPEPYLLGLGLVIFAAVGVEAVARRRRARAK